MAGARLSFVTVIPKACQGSTDPCTNTTLVTSKSNAPYMILVLSTTSSRKEALYLEPKISTHC